MALTADRNVPHKEPASQQAYEVAASTTIYRGSIVVINSSGYAIPAPDTAAATNSFAGIAQAQADNSAGANGDIKVILFTTGRHKLPASSAAITDLQTNCFADDDETVTPVSGTEETNSQKVGTIVEVDGTDVWVDIATGISNPALGA